MVVGGGHKDQGGSEQRVTARVTADTRHAPMTGARVLAVRAAADLSCESTAAVSSAHILFTTPPGSEVPRCIFHHAPTVTISVFFHLSVTVLTENPHISR